MAKFLTDEIFKLLRVHGTTLQYLTLIQSLKLSSSQGENFTSAPTEESNNCNKSSKRQRTEATVSNSFSQDVIDDVMESFIRHVVKEGSFECLQNSNAIGEIQDFEKLGFDDDSLNKYRGICLNNFGLHSQDHSCHSFLGSVTCLSYHM